VESPASPPAAKDPEIGDQHALVTSAFTRRGFLRAAGITGLAGVAASVAACQAAAAPQWSFGTVPSPGAATAAPSVAPSAAPSGHGSMAPSAQPSATPGGWSEHDLAARNVLRRYVGNLAPALPAIYGDDVFAKLADIMGASEPYPELEQKPAFAQVPQLVLNDALAPLEPELDGGVKVFRLTVDEIVLAIDELKEPIPALGFNGTTPGPTIRVTEGDRIRAIFTNNLQESTGIHFHGEEFEDFFMDGIPFLTQKPIAPGESFTYEFTAGRPGSLMYHSHHNATDQVGRGLLGAFIVDPRSAAGDDVFDREYTWISNDVLGGFTINGHGFPAVVPILAAVGETVRVRFMNEGIMYHPFHSHGYAMKVVARDGYPLGPNAYDADTISVGPGERWDVNMTAERLGLWAFHCHILPHVEGHDGMFGMVNVFMVVPKASDIDAIVQLLLA
jgi:manganese oxidase